MGGHFGARLVGSDRSGFVVKGQMYAYNKNIDAARKVALGAGLPNITKSAQAVRGDGLDIYTNFLQYELPLPEVVVCDNAHPPWRNVDGGWCDCVVTDPPYGIRAAAKTAACKVEPFEAEVEQDEAARMA